MNNMSDNNYKRLSPKCMVAMYITSTVILATFLAIILIVTPYLKDLDFANEIEYGLYVVFVTYLIYCIVGPIVFYRRYKYILTNDKVDVLRGIIIVRHTVVPIERIHQVEVIKGPVNNMLGLANVNITTAGGKAKIEFLRKNEAERVAEELNAVVSKILKDRIKNE